MPLLISAPIIEYSPLTYKRIDPKKFKSGMIYVIGFNFRSINTYFPDLRFLKKYFKIGKTTDINARKKNLNTGAPFPTEVIHLIECSDIHSAEVWLHACLNSKRTYGEWFELEDSDLEQLKEIKKLIPKQN